jgi:hypothetical protein
MSEKYIKALIRIGSGDVFSLALVDKTYEKQENGFFKLSASELATIKSAGYEVIANGDWEVSNDTPVEPDLQEPTQELPQAPSQEPSQAPAKAEDVVNAKVDSAKKMAFKKLNK